MVRLLFQVELNRFETNAIVTQKFSFVCTRAISTADSVEMRPNLDAACLTPRKNLKMTVVCQLALTVRPAFIGT